MWGELEDSEPEFALELSGVEAPSCLLTLIGGEMSELVSESEDESLESLSDSLELEDDKDEDELDISSFLFFLGWSNGGLKRGASMLSSSHENYNEQ